MFYAKDYIRAYTTNTTDAALTGHISKVAAPPTGTGVIHVSTSTGVVATVFDGCLIKFFGTDAANETGTYNVWGWKPLDNSSLTKLWLPDLLLTGAFTLGAGVGIAGASVINTEFFADTITSTAGSLDATAFRTLYSPADDTHAWIKFEPESLDYARIEVNVAINSAATVNAIVAPIGIANKPR
jgi:hypothetical protein